VSGEREPPDAATSAPMPETRRSLRRVLLGAAFLMATSAIGPGFLTQTALFTSRLGASFGFAILVSVLFDLAAQLTVWRTVAAARRPAQEVADAVLPGLGTALALLVALGGLAFNIGNVAGAGLGLQAALGFDVRLGAGISALLAILLFLTPEAGRAMDRFAQLLGFVMVGLALYVAARSRPPLGEALARTLLPTRLDALAVVTIVGGTVGGYITFAGAHRLLDAGVARPERMGEVTRSATSGILIASLMRVLLFLAALGVVHRGAALDPANPPASVFRLAAGAAGGRLFGLVMWAAAITSVVGAAYTSVSFLRTLGAARRVGRATLTVAFVLLSTAIFLVVGRPVKVLVAVGALNGLILPLAVASMLLAARRTTIVGGYRHPAWLALAGTLVAVAMAALGGWTLFRELPAVWR
jgi:Mn2+/Fe2+ NRAMP family transporter